MDIKISKTAHACSACNEKFTHDQNVYSHVFVIEEELNRQDLCGQCRDESVRKQAFSSWTTQYYDPKVAEQEPPERFSPLRQLFYESVEADNRLDQARAYLAAQLLRRQKVFRQIKESDEADGEVKLILYSDRIGNRLIEVRDPNFSFNELDKARVHLMARLRILESGEAEPVQTTTQDSESDSTEVTAEALENDMGKQDVVASESATPDSNLAEDTGLGTTSAPISGLGDHESREQQTTEGVKADHVKTI